MLNKKYFKKYKIIVSDEEKYFYFKFSVKTINMTHLKNSFDPINLKLV